MIEDIYKYERCSICGKYKPLKNDVCVDCSKKIEIPDFMKDLFGGFKDEKNN